MKYLRILCIFAVAGFLGLSCAPYQQLKPKPELSFQEQGYLELKNEKKDFVINKNKKYVIAFPKPAEDNFYVVLSLPFKKSMTSFMSASYEKQQTVGLKITDDAANSDTMSVYAIDAKSPSFFWFIENGPADIVLKLKYRYVPQWRFKFENKYTEYKKILAGNLVDRSVYNGIGSTTKLDGLNMGTVIDSVKRHIAALDIMHKELLAIESIFPKSIVSSTDPAYLNYKDIRTKLDDELKFQNAYLTALEFFKKEHETMGNPSDFIANLDVFSKYMDKKSMLAPNVVAESKNILKNRLDEVMPFISMRISGKEDIAPFDSAVYFISFLPKLKTLYEKTELAVPQDLIVMTKFVADFNTKTKAMVTGREELDKIGREVKNGPQMPPDEFFKGIVAKLTTLQSNLPAKIDDQYGKFQSNKSSVALNDSIGKLSGEVVLRLGDCRQADVLVQQLNMLKAQNDFAGMESLLLQSKHIVFVLDKYRDLDKMYLDQLVKNVRSALAASAWTLAEASLKKLNAEQNFLSPTAIIPAKDAAVRELEDALYDGIEKATRARVNKFLEEKVSVLENVDSLYSDSVFFPVYDVTFSAGGRAELAQKKATLIADLAKMKEYEFPAKAIKLCYEQFIKNPEENGVLKARAVVTHGKHYKGDDKDLKLRIIECDPNAPKWIVKPKEYRRIFALPVTDNRKGKNKYYVRLIVNIPTDANFPVYDVDIKLPKEVAQNAATTQWYDEISLNKSLLKNEGRFTISAPSAANEYECQITPVQMNKDKNNVLEITFTHASFKSFPVSIMVQKPIIKKN